MVHYLHSEKGFALTVVAIFAVMTSLIAGTYMSFSVNEIKNAQHQVESTEALYLAEAGLQRALFELKTLEEDPNQDLPSANYTINNFNLNTVAPSDINYRGDVNVSILLKPREVNLSYDVDATATVGSASKTLRAVIRYQPPATVFDYIYFVNNWGWFYGSGITANGDIRSNGRFDIKYNPAVNGHVYASDVIDTHGESIGGLAATEDPPGSGSYPYRHPYSSKLPMPNLDDLSSYEEMATSQGSSISIGNTVIVDGVYGDEVGESNHLVLIGTTANPIRVTGPNVIRGNVVIKGVVEGKGTIYTGRNVYVADDITYKNGPATPTPASQTDTDIESWYNANKTKDIVAFAARESIILGDYSSKNGGSWYANAWLFSMGEEDVGKDGILGTNDQYEGDNIFQTIFEDLDGDGTMDDNYNWTDVQADAAFTQWGNVPAGVDEISDMATNYVDRLDGIFYTNHAFTGRTGYDIKINGAVISKDEAIIYRNYLTMNYDYRIHSRFTKEDPNWLIALGLPAAEDWGIEEWYE